MPVYLAADGPIELWSPWTAVAVMLPFLVMLVGRLTGRSMTKGKD